MVQRTGGAKRGLLHSLSRSFTRKGTPPARQEPRSGHSRPRSAACSNDPRDGGARVGTSLPPRLSETGTGKAFVEGPPKAFQLLHAAAALPMLQSSQYSAHCIDCIQAIVSGSEGHNMRSRLSLIMCRASVPNQLGVQKCNYQT